MNRRRQLLLTAIAAASGSLGLAACSDKPADAPAPAPATKPAAKEAYEMAAKGTGFTVGAVMAANTVYVFFDPQCPHCAALWQNAQPLLNRLKMVWIPVGLLGKGSIPQGATILHAPDPVKAMAENEASIMAKGGGITARQGLSDEQLGKVKANTDLFTQLGADSVPYVVYKNARTGEFGSLSGSMSTEQLAGLVGL